MVNILVFFADKFSFHNSMPKLVFILMVNVYLIVMIE